MNLFQLFFKRNHKKYIVNELIEVISQDSETRLQEIRKRNLQRVIIEFFDSDIAKFANVFGRSKIRIHEYLQHPSNNNSITMDNRFTRVYELQLHLAHGILDKENDPIFDRNYIPFIDDKSIRLLELKVSERESIRYVNPNYHSVNLILLDTSELDQITVSDGNNHETYHRDLLGYIAVINRATNKKITLQKDKNNLEIKGEIIETLRM